MALIDVEIGVRTGLRATHRAPDVTVTTRDVLTTSFTTVAGAVVRIGWAELDLG